MKGRHSAFGSEGVISVTRDCVESGHSTRMRRRTTIDGRSGVCYRKAFQQSWILRLALYRWLMVLVDIRHEQHVGQFMCQLTLEKAKE